ncbi:unnamed protein product [Thelazia callipaeda]|uniref:Reverse transcriptase domain-containing protein n=1 Tax=Thelazia callipaeda TaxID=103827 RepID=A0A0N5D4R0_THECL|nr:unnamed protein product [Thelazia callipaeda]
MGQLRVRIVSGNIASRPNKIFLSEILILNRLYRKVDVLQSQCGNMKMSITADTTCVSINEPTVIYSNRSSTTLCTLQLWNLGIFPITALSLEKTLIQRNYYWYTKDKAQRLQNQSVPFGFDHLPPQSVLCLILQKTLNCDKVIKALKRYKEYVHTDRFI